MIVLANGVFDVLHIGHVLHLQAAAKLGLLYVSITSDAFVNKGPGRPIFPAEQRAHMIRSLECVHGVLIVNDALEALERVRPDIFVKGAEYQGKILPVHQACCDDLNVKIAFTNTKKYSSTDLLHFYDRLQQGS